MSKKFVTSDTHFFHENIIKYCERPFKDAEEMNMVLVKNWNKAVGPEDDVFVVGDFALPKGEHEMKFVKLEELVRRLNGKKHLILGNHDYFEPDEYLLAGFEDVQWGFTNLTLNNHLFTLCHYQMTSWYNSHKGAMHLFGHEHWKRQHEPKHSIYAEMRWSERKFNVCADANNFKPLDLNDVIRAL